MEILPAFFLYTQRLYQRIRHKYWKTKAEVDVDRSEVQEQELQRAPGDLQRKAQRQGLLRSVYRADAFDKPGGGYSQ